MESLGINWVFFLSQLGNFLIVLVVLTKFVYKPIIKLLEDRRKKIDEAEKKAGEIEARRAALSEEEKNILARAKEKAEKEKGAILAEGESDKAKMIEKAKAQSSLEAERQLVVLHEEQEKLRGQITEEILAKLSDRLEKKLAPKKGFGGEGISALFYDKDGKEKSTPKN